MIKPFAGERDYRNCGWAKDSVCAIDGQKVDEAHCWHCGTWGRYFVKRSACGQTDKETENHNQ